MGDGAEKWVDRLISLTFAGFGACAAVVEPSLDCCTRSPVGKSRVSSPYNMYYVCIVHYAAFICSPFFHNTLVNAGVLPLLKRACKRQVTRVAHDNQFDHSDQPHLFGVPSDEIDSIHMRVRQ